MSTKKQTTVQFNKAGESAYNTLIPQASGVMGQFMQDPMKSIFFNNQLAMGNKQIDRGNQSQIATLLNNMRGMGGGGMNPFMLSMLAQGNRTASGNKADLLRALLGQATQARMGAAQQGMGFQPLQTGQTQKTSGLGTWLPQVIGAGLGAATSFATGGASGLLGMGFGGNPTSPGDLGTPGFGGGVNYRMPQQDWLGQVPFAPLASYGGSYRR